MILPETCESPSNQSKHACNCQCLHKTADNFCGPSGKVIVRVFDIIMDKVLIGNTQKFMDTRYYLISLRFRMTPTCYTGQPFEKCLCKNSILRETWSILCTFWWLNIFLYNSFNLRRQICYFRLFIKIVKLIIVISYILSAAPLTVTSIMVAVNHRTMEK